MPKITKRGTELARKLQPMFEAMPADRWNWFDVAGILSLIARHAGTYQRLCETDRNRGLTDAEQAKQDAARDRICQLVSRLPGEDMHADRVSVQFSGDPRGATVKLVLPAPWRRLHDCWAGEGVCV